ncbi:MAG: site-specific integrase [Actinobacteria bacterium]|nr:site-specific integrase [Actinomycetota bacterium]
MASVMLTRYDCRCSKGGGHLHDVFRLRSYRGRDKTGKQLWGRSETFHGSKRAANARAHEIDRELRECTTSAVRKQSVAALLHEWLTRHIAVNRRARTLADYTRIANRCLTPILGEVPLDDLTPRHILDLRDAILMRRSSRTGRPPLREARYAHQVIRSALTYAVKMRYVDVNVARDVEVPVERTVRKGQYDLGLIVRILQAARGTVLGPIIEFIVRTGVRRAEALAIRWRDLDLERGWGHVHQTVQRLPDNGLVFGPTKTHRSERPIRLDPTLVELLRRHQAAQADERALFDATYDDRDLVFCQPNGRPWDPEGITNKYGRLLATHGLPKIRVKDLRHAFASLALAHGAPIADVQAQLGHTTAHTTWTFYADPIEQHQADAVDRLGAALDAIETHEVDEKLTHPAPSAQQGAA